jgi:uncharacterized protein
MQISVINTKRKKNTLVILFFIFIVFSKAQTQIPQNPNGYNKFYHANGLVSSEGSMKDGKPDGYWKNYSEQGIIKIEGNRKNFLLDSVWKFYDTKGRISKTVSYLEGKKNGATITYDTAGKILSKEQLVNDVKQGIQFVYHKNGRTKTSTPFKDGKLDGVVFEYSDDSTLVGMTTYKNGIMQSTDKFNRRDRDGRKQGYWKEFYEDFSLKKEMKYNGDSLDGYVKEYDTKGNLRGTKKYNNGKQILRAPEIANVQVYKEVYDDGTLKYEGVYSDGVPIGSHYHFIQKRRCDSSLFLRDDTSGIYINKLICRNIAVPDSAIEYFDGTVIAKGAVDSLRNRIGEWTEYHNTSEFKGKGKYIAGGRTGDWEFFYPNGKLEQKGKYDKKGRPQGVWKWYYESGTILREENYVNGKREGIMTDYTEDGKILTTGSWVENEKVGHWIYETNDYMEKGSFSNGETDSLWTSFYMPGKRKRYIGSFQSGDPVGLHTKYYDNGQIEYTGKYVSGMKDGDWLYFDEMGFNYLKITYQSDMEVAWQGRKIRPSYEESLRTYNVKIDENKSQTIRK